MRVWVSVLVGIVLVTAGPATASAATIAFNDRTAWNAAVSGVTTIDFEGIAAPGGFAAFGNGPALIGGVTFTTDPLTQLFVVDPAFSPPFYDWGSGAVLNFDFGSPNMLTATLPAGVTAVGFDVMTFEPYAAMVTVDVKNGGIASFPVPTADFPTRTFFGVTSTSAIMSVTISGDSGNPVGTNTDNFSYGTANGTPPPVPEPVTVLMLGFGVTHTIAASRRRRSRLRQ